MNAIKMLMLAQKSLKMRKLLLIAPLLIAAMLVTIYYGYSEPKKEGGITFYDKSWNEVLAKAKAEHKLIFLDVYASWCGPCKMLKRQTFTDKEAGNFFNANFINTSFDGEQGDGIMLCQKFSVQAYPSLYILDANGNVINSTMGYQSPKDLINFGRQALKK
jgi:thiol:disulfide interchange protein